MKEGWFCRICKDLFGAVHNSKHLGVINEILDRLECLEFASVAIIEDYLARTNTSDGLGYGASTSSDSCKDAELHDTKPDRINLNTDEGIVASFTMFHPGLFEPETITQDLYQTASTL